jgi:hypothetical protein
MKPAQARRQPPGAAGATVGREKAVRASSKPKTASPRKRAASTIPKQTEAGFLAAVRALAKLKGYRTYHTHDSRRSEAGFPDLVLVKRPRVIFAELKRDGKKPTAIQQTWLDDLTACGQEAYFWTPAQFEEITRILR